MANSTETAKETFSFPKKLLMPLVEKYNINVEKSKRFQHIVEMFRDRQNYLVWAVKAFYEKNITITSLERISDWTLENQHLIKSLSKENIISYKSKDEINLLKEEISNLNKIQLVKKTIETFNTDQRQMLLDMSCIDSVNSLNTNKVKFITIYGIFMKFSKLIQGTKDNFIKKVSAIRNQKELLNQLKRVIGKNFEWSKECLLDFIKRFCKTTEIIVDKDNILIVRVNSFSESKILGSRSAWCITRDSKYFSQYVINPGTDKTFQYFFFDFNQPENTRLSMIGFTVQLGRGIIHAHDCQNDSCLHESGYTVNGVKTSIKQILNDYEISGKIIMPIKMSDKYRWTKSSFIDYLQNNFKGDNDYKIEFEDDNHILILVENSDIIQEGLGNTANRAVCDGGEFWNKTSDERTYLLLDFSKTYNDDKSTITFNVSQNDYGIESVRISSDSYGLSFNVAEYCNSIGISDDNFIKQKTANPSMLLHHAVNEDSIEQVKDCLEKNNDSINVNHEFNDKTPVHMAIQNNNIEILKMLVTHKSFDISVIDAFGDTIFSNVIYKIRNTHKDTYVEMMEYLLSLDLDFNIKNINNDTLLILACQKGETLWIVDELLKKKNLDLNVVNDNEDTALSEAIKNKFADVVEKLVRDERIEINSDDENAIMNSDFLSEKLKSFVSATEVEEIKPEPEPTPSKSKYNEVLTNSFLKAIIG